MQLLGFISWQQSILDPRLFTHRDQHGSLVGVMGVHVDDAVVGGTGPIFLEPIRKLKDRILYRKM